MNAIKKANDEFKNGNFISALKLYKEIELKNPEFKDILKANILITERKIEASVDVINSDEKILKLMKGMLERRPSNKILSNELLRKYIELVDDVKSDRISLKSAKLALECLEYSPFQVSLLCAVYNIFKSLDLLSLIYGFQLKPSLTIGGLIKLAVDNDYWSAYKNIISKEIASKSLDCKHAFELINRRPPTLKENLRLNNKFFDSSAIKISFGSILLNEQKFIGANLCQHYDFCDEWILVEGACKEYPERKVTVDGLSLDKTKLIIDLFPDPKSKITYIQYGWTNVDGEHAKSELRNEYISRAKGQYLVVVDADEFYEVDDLKTGISDLELDFNKFAIVFPQVHFWKDMKSFITGEYYDISHTRFYKNLPGMKYIRNHNFPELNGKFVHEMGQFKYPRKIIEDKNIKESYYFDGPKCYHMGFAKDFEDMRDKTDYYLARGEATTRISTTSSRAAWFDGDLPDKCRLRSWAGKTPSFLK